MSKPPLSRDDFEALSSYQRGYVVYQYGARDDQPNVPDEKNPYPPGADHDAWNEGQFQGMLNVQDGEE